MPWSRARWQERWFYLLISPWLIGLVGLQLGPLVGGLALAFVDWPLPQPARFVGFTHFRALSMDPLFWRTLANSAYYALGTVPFGMVFGLAVALLLEHRRVGAGLWRGIFTLPMGASGVAMALVWAWIFNPRLGPVNALLAHLRLPGPNWLYDEYWAMPTLILIGLWSAGINVLVYLAALQDVPTSLREAAALDGANNRMLLRHVLWPLLSPATFYLAIVNMIGAFQVFTPSYLLTRGGPHNATLTLPLYIYFNAFSWGNLGYGGALALAHFAAIVALTRLQFRLSGHWVFYRGGNP